MIEIEFDPSVESLLTELDDFQQDMQVKGLQSALVAVAKPHRDLMKRGAPRLTGTLEKSLAYAKLSRGKMQRANVRPDQIAYQVGPVRRVRNQRSGGKLWGWDWLANIIQLGAKPHEIRGRKRRGLAGKAGFRNKLRFNGGVFAKVDHPGTKPDPFIDEAIRSLAGSVDEYFYQGLSRYLDKQSARRAA